MDSASTAAASALEQDALQRRREAVRRAKDASRGISSSRRSSRLASAQPSWQDALGSPHGPWDFFTLVSAFEERETVFAEVGSSGELTFSCASCEHVFATKIWPPADGESASTVAGSQPLETASSVEPTGARAPQAGVDGKTPSLVSQRVLLASIRHHCASAMHKATIAKLWPDRKRNRSDSADLGLTRAEGNANYVVITVNGVKTLVSRQVGGAAIFEHDTTEHDDVGKGDVPTAWMHHAASFVSHPYLYLDTVQNRCAAIDSDGKLRERHQQTSARVRLGQPRTVDESWNPTSASYTPGALAAAGRVAFVHAENDPSVRSRDCMRLTVRTVELPVASRPDTSADFCQVTDGAAFRVLRVSQQQLTSRVKPATVVKEDPEAGSSNLLEEFVSEQVQRYLEYAAETQPLVR